MLKKSLLISLLFFSVLLAEDNPLEVIPEYTELAKKRAEANKEKILPAEDLAVMKSGAEKIALALPSPGLKVGDDAPDFEIKNSDGKIVKLSERLANGPVVLCFFRGSWCPYCNMEMQVLTQSLPLFKKLKAQLITVSPQIIEKSKDLKEKFSGAYEILVDADYAIAKSYKVYHEMPEELTALYRDKFKLDLEAYNGKGRTALPVAGTFVVSREGKIVAAFCDTDYKKRMEPHDILLADRKSVV